MLLNVDLTISIFRKALSDLAIWEPRTFETISRISRETALEHQLDGVKGRLDTENRVFLTNKPLDPKK